MDDNQRQIVRSEETVVAGEPEQTTVSQTHTSTAGAAPAATPAAHQASTVQTTSSTSAPSDQVVAHNVVEQVNDPAAEKAATVNWLNRIIWFVAGFFAILLLIRFILLLSGANPDVGFVSLVYGLTGWLVAPFAGIFGTNLTFEGAATTAQFEPESLVAIVVVLLLAWLLTKLAELMLGTNRTTSTAYSDTERRAKL
jgi:hypothetical protein